MTNIIIVEYLGKPCSINKRYYKNFSLTNEYRSFKEELGYIAKQSMIGKNILLGELGCDIAYFYSKHGKDIDSFIKPVLDALQGIIYDNDKQITKLLVTKAKSDQDRLIINVYQ